MRQLKTRRVLRQLRCCPRKAGRPAKAIHVHAAFYTGPWLDGVRERYGMDPQIKFFGTACITDNATRGRTAA